MSPLTLLNPSRAFLALSAALAGYYLFRCYAYTAGNILIVPYILAASFLLGMADSAWMHLFTRAAAKEDETDAPEANSMFSTTTGYFVGVFLTIGGLMCAMTGGYGTFRAAAVMTLFMLVRAALFRQTEVLAPLFGGLTWGMIFVIGMTAHPSFVEMLQIGETRLPLAFFTIYMIVAIVLSQVRDASRPPEVPEGEELSSEVASRLLEMRNDAIDRTVVWFAGGILVLLPLVLAWVMPMRWLSWGILAYLSVTTLVRLIPVLVYRTRKDLETFIESVFRGSAWLNAGGVASLGDYRMQEVFEGWHVSAPGREEIIAIVIIALLTIPARFFRRVAPVS